MIKEETYYFVKNNKYRYDTYNEVINNFAYLNHKKVIIINKIENFRLVKIHYIEDDTCFYIDEKFLTKDRRNENTLCISIFKGD